MVRPLVTLTGVCLLLVLAPTAAESDELPILRTYPILSVAGEPSADLRDDLLGEALESIVGTLQGELATAFRDCFEFPPIQDVIEVNAEFDPGTDLSNSLHLLEEGPADYVLILRLTVNNDEVQWTARVYEMAASGPSMKVFVQEPRSHLGFYKLYIGTEGRRLLQEKLTTQLVAEVGQLVDCAPPKIGGVPFPTASPSKAYAALPGVHQIMRGDPGRGWSFLLGTSTAAIVGLYADDKAGREDDLAKEERFDAAERKRHEDNRDNALLVRNISIGAGIILYGWSLIDALGYRPPAAIELSYDSGRDMSIGWNFLAK